MTPRNLQTILANRDQVLIIDLGKVFEGELTASMARSTEIVSNARDFEIINNRYLKLSKQNAQDKDMDQDVKNPVLGRWYFDVRQKYLDLDHLIYTGTIFFKGNITK